MLGNFLAALEQTRDQQLLAIGVTEDDARTVCRWDYAEAVAPLLTGDRRRLPGLPGGFFRRFDTRAPHCEIGVAHRPAARGTRVRFRAQAPPAAAAGDVAQRKNRPIVAIDGELLVVAVGDGALRVDQARAQNGAHNLQLLRGRRVDPGGEACFGRKAGSVRGGKKNSALPNEGFELSEAIPTETRAHVVGGVVSPG